VKNISYFVIPRRGRVALRRFRTRKWVRFTFKIITAQEFQQEIRSDAQKRRFRRRPANDGREKSCGQIINGVY